MMPILSAVLTFDPTSRSPRLAGDDYGVSTCAPAHEVLPGVDLQASTESGLAICVAGDGWCSTSTTARKGHRRERTASVTRF